MRRRAKAWFGLISLAALLPGCELSSESSASAALIGGHDVDNANVVAIIARNLHGPGVDAFCSGSVIGPYAVLTAKHCVTNSAVAPPSTVRVYVTGNYFSSPGVERGVAEIRTTPGVSTDGADGTGSADIAVLILDADISSIAAPFPVSFTTPSVGQAVTLHGLGNSSPEREASGSVGAVLAGISQVDQLDGRLCNGDSGGPLEDTASGQIVGVSVLVTNCDPGAYLYAVRVDRHEALVRGGVGYRPGCVGPETCGNGTDDDCNGLSDERCGAFGAPCARAADCMSNLCWVQCTQTCGPSAACPDGRTCAGGLCAPPVPVACGNGLIEAGETCDAGSQNGQYGATCGIDCMTAGPRCGDGRVDAPNEECDDAELNGELGRCSIYCTRPTSCGDGAANGLDPCSAPNAWLDACYMHCGGDMACARECWVIGCTPEACDDGMSNGQYGKCASDCAGPGLRCGDRVRDEMREQCDDGNTANGDGCSSTCVLERGGAPGPDGGMGDDDDDDGGCEVAPVRSGGRRSRALHLAALVAGLIAIGRRRRRSRRDH